MKVRIKIKGEVGSGRGIVRDTIIEALQAKGWNTSELAEFEISARKVEEDVSTKK